MPNKTVQVIKLRDEGKTYEEIGKVLGISTTSAWKQLNNEKKRIAVELEEERTARARESEERFDVIAETEKLVGLTVRAAQEAVGGELNRLDGTKLVNAAWTGLKLLAQLRGEFIEKRESKNENKTVEDIDIPYFEELLERFGDNGNGRP